nr:MAG TPA: hypothetical protein [Caudoviricetes sp.]
MSVCMLFMFCIIVTVSWINVMPYIPTQRRMPRHSSLGIATMKMFDRPAMVPIEY